MNGNTPNTAVITADDLGYRYTISKDLGEGGDGIVKLYKPIASLPKGIDVVVKSSRDHRTAKDVENEARKLARLSQCDNIVKLLGSAKSFPVVKNYSVFLEHCTLGDLHAYCGTLSESGIRNVPEQTIWTCFVQIAAALNFCHNGPEGHQGHWDSIMHCDIKPGNILVAQHPNPSHGDILPIFKLADFSRAKFYHGPLMESSVCTYEYEPPERPSTTLAADVWGVGGVIHWFATKLDPVESVEEYKRNLLPHRLQEEERQAQHDEDFWRKRRHRKTLDLTMSKPRQCIELRRNLVKRWEPYSAELNWWMHRALDFNQHRRITSRQLVQQMVPEGKKCIEILCGIKADKDGDVPMMDRE